mgnify:CR=1 FL=1
MLAFWCIPHFLSGDHNSRIYFNPPKTACILRNSNQNRSLSRTHMSRGACKMWERDAKLPLLMQLPTSLQFQMTLLHSGTNLGERVLGVRVRVRLRLLSLLTRKLLLPKSERQGEWNDLGNVFILCDGDIWGECLMFVALCVMLWLKYLKCDYWTN